MNKSVHNTCRPIITLVYDQSIVATVGPKWRDDHYSIEVEKLIAITSHRSFKTTQLPTYEEVVAGEPDAKDSPVLANYGHFALPSTMSEMEKISLGNASQNQVSVRPPPDDTEDISAPIALDRKASQAAYSGFLLTPPSSHTSPRYCPFCKKLMTAINIRRHIRTVHISSHRKRLPCPVSTCKSTFNPTRPDNVVKHMGLKHGKTSRKRCGANKKQKIS